jgi:hypothetical protein
MIKTCDLPKNPKVVGCKFFKREEGSPSIKEVKEKIL